MTTYNPSVSTTIFPRINFYKNFTGRAVRRDLNGRIYGKYGDVSIDEPSRYPEVDGSVCLNGISFPLDLGPDVTTPPTRVIDLRNDCGTPTKIDLGRIFQGTSIQDETFPLDLGPSVNDAITGIIQLDNDKGSPATIDLGIFYSGTSIQDETFPLDLGPDVTVTPTSVIQLTNDKGSPATINLNPLN